MNEHAYDISHLVDQESAAPAVSATPRYKLATAPAAPAPPSIQAFQAALGQELLQNAGAHDALIEEYVRGGGGSPRHEPRH